MNDGNDKGTWKRTFVLFALLLVIVSVGFAARAQAAGDHNYAFRFLDPHHGETVNGVVLVRVLVPFDGQLMPYQDVRLTVDGGEWRRMSYQGDNVYAAKWDTTQVQNGWHELTAIYVARPGSSRFTTTQIAVFVCQPLMPCVEP